MNKCIKYSLVMALGITMSSCGELDTQPFESYDDQAVWGSKEGTEAFIVKAYNGTVTNFNGYARNESLTPNSILSNLTNLDTRVIDSRISNNTGSAQGLGDFFANLRECNLIIERASLPELKAEGHFLRGVLFFYQTLWQGRFVPITKVLTQNSQDEFKTPYTKNPTESYQYIIEDLTIAANGMVEVSSAGRANKYAAHAFRSRAALQAYAYTKDAKYLDIAQESAEAIINSGRYQLTDNYGSLFLKEGEKSSEIILGHYRLSQNTRVGSITEMQITVPNINNNEVNAVGGTPFNDAKGRTFECWAQYFPTQDLVDQYLVIDQVDKTAKPWYETSQYVNNVESGDISSLTEGSLNTVRHKVPEKADLGTNAKGNIIVRYDKIKSGATIENISNIMYQHRDKRFYHTIVYDQSSWLGENVETNICGNLWAGVREGQSDSWYTTASGYYWRKSVRQVEPRVYVSNNTDFHYVLARLGEVYMNLAEIYLLKNNVAKAVEMLNVTRVKHGGLPVSTANTMSEAWADYIRERRVEMAYENDLYWSYLRWGKYGNFANEGATESDVIQALNKPVHKIQITKDRTQIMIAQITRNGAWERTFSTKRYLYPIPQSILDSRAAHNIKDEQNPGW
ncbi:RagB/SusD family nutrient uptake outer membrane protein [Capnocytophaga canis]|uniref:RagB/SusD family nutrient uptake outer membrane protein n=1 Tax=Capnocytophaga canis TaxID=1848903 RepID=UPI00370D4DDF